MGSQRRNGTILGFDSGRLSSFRGENSPGQREVLEIILPPRAVRHYIVLRQRAFVGLVVGATHVVRTSTVAPRLASLSKTPSMGLYIYIYICKYIYIYIYKHIYVDI